MGIENDTVSLGGYIQNKFTIVKIAKKQFKRIVDEKGNDLLTRKAAPKRHPQPRTCDSQVPDRKTHRVQVQRTIPS